MKTRPIRDIGDGPPIELWQKAALDIGNGRCIIGKSTSLMIKDFDEITGTSEITVIFLAEKVWCLYDK